jgi:hypothetical protein
VTSFANGLHKDGAVFSACGWGRIAQADFTNGNILLQTGSGTEPGIAIGAANNSAGFGGKLVFACYSSSSALALTVNTPLAIPVGSLFFFAFAFDETAGTWSAQINGVQASGSGATYSSPSAATLTAGLVIKSNGDPSGGYSGDILSNAMWSRKQSASEQNSIFEMTRSKHGV